MSAQSRPTLTIGRSLLWRSPLAAADYQSANQLMGARDYVIVAALPPQLQVRRRMRPAHHFAVAPAASDTAANLSTFITLEAAQFASRHSGRARRCRGRCEHLARH